MGACCKLFAKGAQPDALKDDNNKTELISKNTAFKVVRHTANDSQFTYFIDVFDLSDCGQSLKLPEFATEQNPAFSYQNFHQKHREYYGLVKQLGRYLTCRTREGEQLRSRVEQDCEKIQQGRQLVGFGKSKLPGCLVKLEIQGVSGRGVEEVTILHHHPQQWRGKFEENLKLSLLQKGPAFFQFVIPQIFTSTVRIVAHPRSLQLNIPLNDSFEAGRLTFCQIVRWKGGGQGQGVALRMQLCESQEGERLQAMSQLYSSLMRQFEHDAPLQQKTPANDKLSSRVSRHRSSLNQHYNLNNNSMF